MHVSRDMIRADLRLRGSVADRFLGKATAESFRSKQGLVRRFVAGRAPKGLGYAEETVAGSSGRPLRLCVYRPDGPVEGAVGLLWMHGGGYAFGAPEQDVGFIRAFIETAPCVVVSPDYALSVDAPYPAALEDCYAALRWMQANAAALGICDDQLFVGGDSAGGGLAAATALYARDRGEVAIAFQMPLYPMLDDRGQTRSMEGNDAPIWNEARNKCGWRMYLGDLYGSLEVPKYAAPARETDLRGLPPAYSYIGSVDPFLDEARSYFDRLCEAGVAATIDVYEGCYHGFEIVNPGTSVAKQARAGLLAAFGDAAGTRFAGQPRRA